MAALPPREGHDAAAVAAPAPAPQTLPAQQADVRAPLCNRRRYRHATLPNGLRVLAIQDDAAAGDSSSSFFGAACASVAAGYFDDAPDLPGAAHFLEHMVHLGSEAFPDEREYKAFLAAHGGASNASTSLAHTRYHLRVHADALQGALARLGAALSAPLLAPDSAAREVENVHAEYSRNCNSDARKLLQLKRSLGRPPYSSFSTGSLQTLWTDPSAKGVSVPDALRQLWASRYAASTTTLAVVGPQAPETLLAWVQDAFGGMQATPASSSSSLTRKRPLQAAAGNGAGDAAPGTATDTCSNSSSSSSSASEADDDRPPGRHHHGGAASSGSVHAKAAQGPSAPGSEDEACFQVAAAPVAAAAPLLQQAAAQPAAVGEQQQQQQQQQQGWRDHPADVFDPAADGGRLVLVAPQRDLRELQLVFYIPSGAMQHSRVKPWHWASHLLGHEVPGSVAHLLKAQGLVQSLSVGVGDEVRLGRGWMFWTVTATLTAAGEEHVQHVAATVFRGIQVLASCTDEQLRQTWDEVARLAALKFDYRDRQEPLAAAQAAAYALHYYAPAEVLSGPSLLSEYDPHPLRWFVQQLTPEAVNIFWISRRHAAAADTQEPFYGARCAQLPLPADWHAAIKQQCAVDGSGAAGGLSEAQAAPQPCWDQQGAAGADGGGGSGPLTVEPGQLHLPPPNWALASDFGPRQQEPEGPAAAAAAAAAGGPDGAPVQLINQAGLCLWHRLDTSFGLPKLHLKLHLVTACVSSTPAATVAARLLVAVLHDVLLPLTYPAELAGSYLGLSTGAGSLAIKVAGFQGVAQHLLVQALQALAGLTEAQVQQRFATMAGRLRQGLTNWSKNNPSTHSEYAAHHLLLEHHHHTRQLLAALDSGVSAADVLALARQLASGVGVHADLLAYGNISRAEAAGVAQQVQRVLQPRGLPAGEWPALRRVRSLAPQPLDALDAPAAGQQQQQQQPCLWTLLPDNPNPANSNNAVYVFTQLGPDDDIDTAVALDLAVSMSKRECFHELRTKQRLGYTVSLGSATLGRQLALAVIVQSPSTPSDVLAAAITDWLSGWCAQGLGALLAAQPSLLSYHKQSLRARYLQQPQSLREAASRAWGPISSRSLDWQRRPRKAAVLAAMQQRALIAWVNEAVHPAASRVLCVHLRGGGAAGQAGDAEHQSSAAPHERVLREGSTAVESFIAGQPTLPLPDQLLLPPPAAAAS